MKGLAFWKLVTQQWKQQLHALKNLLSFLLMLFQLFKTSFSETKTQFNTVLSEKNIMICHILRLEFLYHSSLVCRNEIKQG